MDNQTNLPYLNLLVSNSGWVVHRLITHFGGVTRTSFYVQDGEYLQDVTLPLAGYFGWRLEKTQSAIVGNFDDRVERDLSRLFVHRVLVLTVRS